MMFTLLLVAALQAPAPSTNDSVLEARTREVASVLRCPVCQGLSIQSSPSELAVQMKEVVRQQLREGRSPEEVKAYFVSKYGEWVLLEPKAEGANLLVYGLPILLLFGGMVVILVVVRKWSRQGTASSAPITAEEEDILV